MLAHYPAVSTQVTRLSVVLSVPCLWRASRGVTPLALTARKSWLGHSEPGAGVAGVVHYTAMAQAAALPTTASTHMWAM